MADRYLDDRRNRPRARRDRDPAIVERDAEPIPGGFVILRTRQHYPAIGKNEGEGFVAFVELGLLDRCADRPMAGKQAEKCSGVCFHRIHIVPHCLPPAAICRSISASCSSSADNASPSASM